MGNYLKYDNKNKYRIFLNKVTTIDIITEENKKKVMGTLVGGSAGLLLLGPLGAIGGLLLGGNKKMVNIAVGLNDGRHFVGSCTAKTHLSLLKFKGKGGTPTPANVETPTAPISGETKECPMCAETVKAKAKICRFCRHEFKFKTKKIDPPAKTKEATYDVHFRALLKEYYEEDAIQVTQSIIGCSHPTARSYVLWNEDDFSGIIKERSLSEAKKFQMKFEKLGGKVNYCKNKG
jgi:hypothetical protein